MSSLWPQCSARCRGPGQGLRDATPLSSAPRTAFWHTLRGRASRFPEFTRRRCPCLALALSFPAAKDAQRAAVGGCGETPAAHQAGGSQWPGKSPGVLAFEDRRSGHFCRFLFCLIYSKGDAGEASTSGMPVGTERTSPSCTPPPIL